MVMKIKLITQDGTLFLGELKELDVGVIEVEHKLFAYTGIAAGYGEFHERKRLAMAFHEFEQVPPPKQLRIGAAVVLRKVHRDEDKKYIGQYARIFDSSGISTDWRIQFGNDDIIGVLSSEIELLP